VSLIYFTLKLKNDSLPFRGTSSAMNVFCEDEKIDKAPSHETCIQWNLKVGLYKLLREKKDTTEWCWIVDHVLGSGPLKCLAVLGIPLDVLNGMNDLTLSLSALEPFGLIPMAQTTGNDVNKALVQISERTGIIPRSIVSDHGSDLWLGIKGFCKEYGNKTVEHHDVCHKVAIELKKLFLNDPAWSEFCEKAAQAKRQLFNTKGVCYAPPNQRRKSRYQNTDILIGWAIRTLNNKEQIPSDVLQKLKWVFDYQQEIEHWNQWILIGRHTRDEIRRRGFGEGADERLATNLISIQMTKVSEDLACNLMDYVSIESGKLSSGEKALGSTEVIESLFGYFKYTKAGLWDRHCGIGRLILSMACRVGELSKDFIKTALETVKVEDVVNWLGRSLIRV
jgi:hypothetical protein